MTIVNMMQTAIHQIINMVTMRNSFMATARSMYMITTAVYWEATVRVFITNCDYVFILMILMGMMQMTVVNIIYMTLMTNRRVATVGPMLMFGVGSSVLTSHISILLKLLVQQS